MKIFFTLNCLERSHLLAQRVFQRFEHLINIKTRPTVFWENLKLYKKQVVTEIVFKWIFSMFGTSYSLTA